LEEGREFAFEVLVDVWGMEMRRKRLVSGRRKQSRQSGAGKREDQPQLPHLSLCTPINNVGAKTFTYQSSHRTHSAHTFRRHTSSTCRARPP
jgi:hypothetical protein